MGDFTVRYSDWKGGDYGNRDPAKADSDQYTGLNVYPYESGLVGVRAGTKLIPTTGIPGHTTVPGPLAFSVRDSTLVTVIGSTPYSVPIAGGAATAWAAYPSVPLKPIKFLRGAGVTYSLSNGALYKHATTASTVVVPTPFPLSYIVRWGYYFVGIDQTRPWRIWFSTVNASGAQFDTWGANDFLDIGDTEAITAMVPIFNTLYIGKPAGWNAVSGVLGTLASVRGAASGNGPVDPRLTTLTTDNRILYWPVEANPAWFNGERVQLEPEQSIGARSTAPFTGDTVVVTPTSRRLVMANDTPAGTQVLTWANSSWTRHLFPAKLAALSPPDVQAGANFPADIIYAALAPTVVGDAVVIGAYHHQLDRPGHTADTYAAPIDTGTTALVAGEVAFPSYWEPIGRQVQVRGIIVQFRKWASGVAGALNEVQVRLDAHGAWGRGPTTGETHHWYEPCERSSTSGTDESWRINVGQQGWGNGFRLHFPKLVGVALREVIVLCNVRTERT